VSFNFSFLLSELGERLNSTGGEVIDPGAGLGNGENNSVPGLLLERRRGRGEV
jgi:hypothetical protein